MQILLWILLALCLSPILIGIIWGIVDPVDDSWPDWKERH
jgi:hypothetical protein